MVTWFVGTTIVVVICLSGTMCFRSLMSQAPYGGLVDGTVISKTVIVHQTRWGTRLEYVLNISASGEVRRTVVPWRIYSTAKAGWRLHQRENIFELSTPDGKAATHSHSSVSPRSRAAN